MRTFIISILFSMILCTTAQGIDLQSATNVGYAATDHSTQGFNKASGSQLGFDAAARLSPQLSLGLKSTGSGNQHEGVKFYRLATGPFLSVNFYENYSVFSALGYFNESGLNGSGERVFRAKGYQMQWGWLRSHHMTNRVSLGWGGFWTRFWGKAKRMPTSTDEGSLFVRSDTHMGNQRGLQASLQILF